MKYRKLGKTSLNVSELGYGTWQFANDSEMWVGASREESERSLLEAIDNGVNFIDTARSYGDGLSEKWIGEIIKKRRDKKIIIASKINPKNWQWPAIPGTNIKEVFPKDHIVSLVEQSLKTLKIDTLDVMLFHVWIDEWADEDEWKETIQKLTKEDKVKYWGISTNNNESTNCVKACDTGLISVVETIFNVFYQEPVETLFPYTLKNNIGIIARVPLDEGSLSGNINSKTKFAPGDFRNSYFSQNRLIELEERIKKLQLFINETRSAETLAELALRYNISYDAVSTTIPGMRKTAHVIENIRSVEKGKLDHETLEGLKEHSWIRNFYA